MADFYVSAIMLRPFRVLGCWGAALMASMIIDLMDSISDLRSPKNGPFDQIQEESEEDGAGEGATTIRTDRDCIAMPRTASVEMITMSAVG